MPPAATDVRNKKTTCFTFEPETFAKRNCSHNEIVVKAPINDSAQAKAITPGENSLSNSTILNIWFTFTCCNVMLKALAD